MMKLFIFGLVTLITSLQLGFAVEGDVDQSLNEINILTHDLYKPASRDTIEVIIGSPVTGNVIPFWGQIYDACRFQVLFLQSEINVAGDIVKFAFQPAFDGVGVYNNFRMYCCHTSVTQLSSVFDDNYAGNTPVEVINEPSFQVGGPAGNWMEWDINFSYNNTDNLLIEIKWNGDNGVNVALWRTNETVPRRLYAWDDMASSGTLQNTGNYVKLTISTAPGVKEEVMLPAKENRLGATIINGPLHLPEGKEYKILDIIGRKVSPQNIQPGVYFIEIEGKIAQKVIKVR